MGSVGQVVATTDRVEVPHLVVGIDVAGRTHTFSIGDFDIEIELPPKEELPPTVRGGSADRSHNRHWALHSWAPQDGQLTATEAWPEYVRIRCVHREPVSIDFEVDRTDPQAMHPIRVLQDDFSGIQKTAIAHWLDIMRWKSGEHSLGRQGLGGASWEARPLKDAVTDQELMHGSVNMAVKRFRAVTSEVWHEAQAALKTGDQPPLPFLYHSEGVEQLALGNVRRAILDFAIAAEVHVKTQIDVALHPGTRSSVRELIQRAPAIRHLESLFQDHLDAGDATTYQGLKARLKGLFKARNSVVHKGTYEVSRDSVQAYRDAVESLLELTLPANV